MRHRRSTKPSDEILDAITAAAARGDEAEVARSSRQAQHEHNDQRRQAEPLDGIS